MAKVDLDLWGHETVDNGVDLEPEVDLFPDYPSFFLFLPYFVFLLILSFSADCSLRRGRDGEES